MVEHSPAATREPAIRKEDIVNAIAEIENMRKVVQEGIKVKQDFALFLIKEPEFVDDEFVRDMIVQLRLSLTELRKYRDFLLELQRFVPEDMYAKYNTQFNLVKNTLKEGEGVIAMLDTIRYSSPNARRAS